MADLIDLSASELGDAIAARKISPVEVAEACLAQIGRLNGRLNAFVTLDEAGTRAAAKAAEAQIMRGDYLGPLHGIPIAHKDLYETRGMRTTAGSRVLEHHVPDTDATVVRRLSDAGMVLLGKTNTHEFAFGPTNEHSMFGAVHNPWDLTRISGGSSGGAGAAIAARMTPLASGSDTGGSIRMPAACCGVTGLKPTYGRVSRAGIFPLCWTMDHAGPLARTVRDAALFLQATAGHDKRDAASSHAAVPDYMAALTGGVRGLRIGVPRRYFFDRSQDSVTALVDAALDVLAGLGAELVEIDIPHIEAAAAAALAIYLGEATAYHDDTLDDRAHLYTEQVRTFLELGDQLLAKDYIHAQRYRSLLGRELTTLFGRVDLIATPGIAMTATPIGGQTVTIRGTEDSVFGAILRNTEPFNLVGLPALVLPCGFDAQGLPASLQLVGPAFSEALVLRAGDAYQRATDWHTRRPPV